MSNKQSTQRDPIIRQASSWLARAEQGKLSARQQARFKAWREADPRHEQAVRQVQNAWQLASLLRNDPAYSDLPARPAKSRKPSRFKWPSLPPIWGWPALATVLIALGLIGSNYQDLSLSWKADYHTKAGEIRLIELADGSQVRLGSRSALTINYTDDAREVTLLNGEAIFTPAPRNQNEPRAFSVLAAGARSTALGTEYAVRVQAEEGWIGVLQHSVELQLPSGSGHLSQQRLQSGDSAHFSQSNGIQPDNSNLADQTSWQHGNLIFRRQPLSDVINRLEQFYSKRILLLTEERAAQPVSAIFPLENLPQLDETLRRELGVNTLTLPGLMVIY